MREAMLYRTLDSGQVRCNLCAHQCTIAAGKKGICCVRENRDGVLHTLVYGRTIAQHVDPIEKKPLFHFHPGSTSYSIATPGCNFRCEWCQNSDISQMPREQHLIMGNEASPEDIVSAAQQAGCRSISYTYTEPTVFFEYTFDTARLARAGGLANVYVTNGYMTPETLETIHPYLDAANVDLKAFRDDTYKRYIGARLQPVLESLKLMKRLGIWVEVTTLIIPTINDDPAELRETAQFLARELGTETPWHLSRFFPMYRVAHIPPTPVETLRRAREIGREAGLRYVYIGNVAGTECSHTVCHGCGRIVVEREGYRVRVTGLQGSSCRYCGTELHFIL